MIYANLIGYGAIGLGGFVIGMLWGHKWSSELKSLLDSLEGRVAKVEHTLAGSTNMTTHAAALEHHAQAVQKLAIAIERHAAAVDDHGAATVAAAVESGAYAFRVSNSAAPAASMSHATPTQSAAAASIANPSAPSVSAVAQPAVPAVN